jgi:putative transposase
MLSSQPPLINVLRGPVEPALAAVIFGERCEQLGIDVSMGSIGDCYDNAVCEAFHATVKRERVHRRPWSTYAELRPAVFEYIEGFYNTQRRHSTVSYNSPAGYESLCHVRRQTEI